MRLSKKEEALKITACKLNKDLIIKSLKKLIREEIKCARECIKDDSRHDYNGLSKFLHNAVQLSEILEYLDINDFKTARRRGIHLKTYCPQVFLPEELF